MRILFDINHPAHVHNLRHVIAACDSRGWVARVAARPKDVTERLLTHYRIPYSVLAPIGRGRIGALRELVVREARFVALARSFKPRVIVGTTVHAGRAGLLSGARSVVLNEDNVGAGPLFVRLAYPLATAVVTPDCLAHERHGARHLTYPSYQELLYLHPDRFAPDAGILGEIGLPPRGYAIVRLSALDAHHDVGVRGMTIELVRRVADRVRGQLRLFVTSERPLAPELEPFRLSIPPERMHDALAFAAFFLGDSQTMTAEAALLGTPALRLNDFVGRLSYLEQIESYGLAFGFKPGEEARLLDTLDSLLRQPARESVFAERRQRVLREKIDPLPWLLGTIEAVAE